MADSTNPFDIPAGQFELVAGYVDGAYAWSEEGWLYHTKSRLVSISCTTANVEANVLDVEAGCADIPTAVQWTQAKRARGEDPTLYFSASLYGQVKAAFDAIGQPVPLVWIADWDGVFGPWYGAVAKQYANPTLSGFHYDLSWVADYWPGVDVGPAPAPLPVPIPTPAPPTPVPPVDGVRAAYGDLSGFLTTDLPNATGRLNLMAGLFRPGS